MPENGNGRALKHELALFDFDGTLANSLGWIRRATQRLADEFGFKRMTDEEMDRFRDSSPATILSGFGIPLWKMPRIATAMRRLMAEECDQIRLYEGIERFLQTAGERGLRLGMVSSNSEENIRVILGVANAGKFDVFECGASLLGKASKLKRAAKKAGVPVAQSIYIGDEIRDLEAAAKVGMPFGAVAWGFCRMTAFAQHRPAARFGNVVEMERYLCGNESGADGGGISGGDGTGAGAVD